MIIAKNSQKIGKICGFFPKFHNRNRLAKFVNLGGKKKWFSPQVVFPNLREVFNQFCLNLGNI
jgi:hypothetical protein